MQPPPGNLNLMRMYESYYPEAINKRLGNQNILI